MSGVQTDVIIVGGGLVGATLACSLTAVAGLRTTLVEQFRLGGDARYIADFDARSSALSASTRLVFERIGVWTTLAPHIAPIARIHVSDRGRFGSTTMDAVEEGMPALGYVAENRWIGSVLASVMQHASRLDIRAPARATAVSIRSDAVEVVVQADDETALIRARLLVIADGVGSPLAASLGIRSEEQAYGHDALIANVGHRRAHQGMAYERFSDQGPMAMLPLVNDADGQPRSALVWVRPEADARRLVDLRADRFARELQQAYGYRLGRLERVGQRQSYPLRLVRSSEQARQRLVVLGNAAHTLHPVAGQGFNLSVRDVWALTQRLQKAQRQGRDIGELALLAAYHDERLMDQERTIIASDLLPRIFGTGLLPVALGRDAALVGLQLIPGLRSGFVRYATGLGDNG